MRKGAEEAYTIATDKNNNVVQIHRVSKGSAGATSVPPIEAGGTLLRAPGATTVYFIHQHPARDPKPSAGDLAISKTLKAITELRGIDFRVVIMADSPPRYLIVNLERPVATSSVHDLTPEIKKRVASNLTTKLPVGERFITPVRGYENAKAASSSVEFRALMETDYHDMEGIVLLDGKNFDLGFIPWPKGVTMKEFTAQAEALTPLSTPQSFTAQRLGGQS